MSILPLLPIPLNRWFEPVLLWLKSFHQVLCAATKEKLLHKFVYALLGGTKLFTLEEVDLGTKPPQITGKRCFYSWSSRITLSALNCSYYQFLSRYMKMGWPLFNTKCITSKKFPHNSLPYTANPLLCWIPTDHICVWSMLKQHVCPQKVFSLPWNKYMGKAFITPQKISISTSFSPFSRGIHKHCWICMVWGLVHMGSQVPLMSTSPDMEAKPQLLSLKNSSKFGLYSIKVESDSFMQRYYGMQRGSLD